MRPQEILGMVEEAAGTRMFEEKKEKGLRTIAKKNRKVEELQATQEEEVGPRVNKLREEKRAFVQWQRSCTELERIARTLRAWEYTEAHQRVAAKEEEIAAAEKEVATLKKDRKRYEKEIGAAEKEMGQVNAQRDGELKKGGKFKKLEEDVNEYGKDLAKRRTQVEIKTSTIKDEEGKIAASEKELQEVGAENDAFVYRCLPLSSFKRLWRPSASKSMSSPWSTIL